MKNRLPFVALAAAVLVMPGCQKDFLTEVPADFVAPEAFYRNAADAIAATNAAYATFINLQGLSSNNYVGRNFWMVTEYPTEVVTSRLSRDNERSVIDNYNITYTSSHPYLEGIYQAAYAGINRANAVLTHVPGIPMDETRKTQLLGEAKFLRALHYYNLAGLFGGVPLKLEETTSILEGQISRATAAETWAQIAKDLTEAAAVLPQSWAGADYGRATRGAALTLLAKAYMQSTSQVTDATAWTKALAALTTVQTLGYSLDPNYASLFNGTNEKSPEIIFSLQNVAVDGQGGTMTEWFSPITNPPIYQGGAQNQFQAERAFYDSYHANDARKEGTWLTSFNTVNATTGAPRTVTWAWTSGIQNATNYGSTGPAVRKYLDLASADGGSESPDVILLRYADVLLLKAEAINEVSGPTAEALALVNQVRARAARTAATPIPPVPAGLSQAQFRDTVFTERRYELALEMHGLFDSRRNWPWYMQRLGASMTGITAKNASPFTSSTTKFDARVGGVLPDKWKLYAIPAGACELNTTLVQNTGWPVDVCDGQAP
jgi:starch-binding outer membrane protein, SusD/RagB family